MDDRKKLAEIHQLVAELMRKQGIEHTEDGELDRLHKTVIEMDALPERIVLIPDAVAIERADYDHPADALEFVVKMKSLDREATIKILEALPVEYGVLKFEPAGPTDGVALYHLVLERTQPEEGNRKIEVWQKQTDPQGTIDKVRVSDGPWDGAASNYPSTEAYCEACLIDMNPEGEEKVQALCHLPVKEPNGALNRNGIHAAAARLNQTKVPPEERARAADKLRALYREIGEEPPESLAKTGDRILKVDEEERMVYGVVMEPDTVDTQGDWATAEEIRKAAHSYLEYKQHQGVMHKFFNFGKKLRIMESYIAPVDFQMEGERVKQGSWIMATRVDDDGLWQAVKDGKLTGYSIGGTGKRRTTQA